MFLSIYTPTYNRRDLLKRCYNSLCNENSKYFEWIIVDDGSNDNTEELVNEWINENKIKIKYVYKENQGVHSARNIACEVASGELCMCIDSDDYLKAGSVQEIYDFFISNNTENIVGIIALNMSTSGDIVGDLLPKNLEKATLYELYKKIGIKGDKKLIYKTDIIKKYKYPVYAGEKRIPPSYVYYQIDNHGELLLLNKPVCIVEYQVDGISNNARSTMISSPRGMLDYYKLMYKISETEKEKYSNMVRIQSYKYLCGESLYKIIFSEFSIINILVIPFSICWLIKNRGIKS